MHFRFTPFLLLLWLNFESLFAQTPSEPSIEQQLAASQKFNFFALPTQSSDFIRMPSRGASTDVDAVFYNLAGTAFLPEGFHISISNLALRQETSIESDYKYMNSIPTKFEGSVSTPVFPALYAVYRRNKLSISVGVNPTAGGGGAEFKGLPVTERNIADIIPNLQNIFGMAQVDSQYRNINAYNVDFRSTGVAFFAGAQIGGAYRFNKYLSVAGGVRYVFARISSEGHTRDLTIFPDTYNDWVSPGEYCRFLTTTVSPLSAVILNVAADQLDANTGNREIDVVQTGNGFTPMFGVHVQPFDGLDIGIKYEFNTNVDITTKVNDGKDGRVLSNPASDPLFIDGSTVRSDLPAILAGGVAYKILNKKLTVAAGGRYVFSKKANYNGREKLIDKNYYEIETALAYHLNPDLTISGGYTFGNWSVMPAYQTDVDFWTNSHTLAIGGQYAFSEKIEINLGVMRSVFAKEAISYTHTPVPAPAPFPSVETSTFTNTYKRNALLFAIGVDIHLNRKKS